MPNFRKLVTNQALMRIEDSHPAALYMSPSRSFTSIRNYASDVNIFQEFLPRYIEYLYICIRHVKTGCLYQHISTWNNITSDQEEFQTFKK